MKELRSNIWDASNDNAVPISSSSGTTRDG